MMHKDGHNGICVEVFDLASARGFSDVRIDFVFDATYGRHWEVVGKLGNYRVQIARASIFEDCCARAFELLAAKTSSCHLVVDE